jgi:hypothetical protein
VKFVTGLVGGKKIFFQIDGTGATVGTAINANIESVWRLTVFPQTFPAPCLVLSEIRRHTMTGTGFSVIAYLVTRQTGRAILVANCAPVTGHTLFLIHAGATL